MIPVPLISLLKGEFQTKTHVFEQGELMFLNRENTCGD